MGDDHLHRQNPPTDVQSSKHNPNPNSGELGASSSSGINNHHQHMKTNYPNRPDLTNPDPATLRDQWKYAIRQYSKWYSHAWGTAILAGVSFFALGWIIKGENPIPSFHRNDDVQPPPDPAKSTR